MKLRRKMRHARSHAMAFIALGLVAALAMIGFRSVMGVQNTLRTWISDLPEVTSSTFEYAEDSYMYASDGSTLLAKFQIEKRDPIELSAVNDVAIRATIDIEDVRFYEHDGIDYPGILRAVVNNIRGGTLEGASTITMQLVRNTALSDEASQITFKRKVREAELAIQLESKYSKDEILNMYLNTINYGDGCYGIQAAAVNYFQVGAADLSLTQAATLAGIPQSPTAYNPKDNPQACLQRRNLVLDRMLTYGDITQEEHDAAVATELALNPAPDEPVQGIYAYPYFTSFVRDELLAPENKYGCTYADLFEGGLKIYTTLDVGMQEAAEQVSRGGIWRTDDAMEAAIVAMDPRNGYVKCIVGGSDYYADQWNVAVQGGRPCGSSFKTFTLAAAIEMGVNPETKIDCSNPVTLSTGQTVNNYGNQNLGTRTLADATAVSSNTGFYRLADKLGADKIIEMAHRMGITSPLSPFPIITLGTENVTPLEMADAYSTLATGGLHRDYVIITRIEDKHGKVLYENVDNPKRVLDEKVAGAVTNVLRGVLEKSYGTAYGCAPNNGQQAAGKSGTGMDYRDHWFVGYCPQLTCAIWTGHRDYSPTSASATAQTAWHDFMSTVLAGTELIPFPSVPAPNYSNNALNGDASAARRNSVTTNAQNFTPGTLTESDVKELYPEYDLIVTHEYSAEYPEGKVISMSVNNAYGDIDLVVSQGPDPNPAPIPAPEPEEGE